MTQSPISPWIRPLILAGVALITLGVALISGVIDIFLPGVGLRFGTVVMDVLAMVPEAWINMFRDIFIAYALVKSGQLGVQAYASAKYDPPMRPDPDEEK